ncbi:MAG: LPXTG cell wall anchor domain-containing protein, partial [Lachnospiraceae bacterium]|nr:LPXTG cell wall anchor domain-containing protein [Lachnospiraceae bacterium]
KNIDADGDGKIDNVGPATGDEGMRPMMAVLLGAVLAMAVLLLIKRRFAR